MPEPRDLKEIQSSLKSINNSLKKMADNTVSRSCINIELTYSPEEIDRVLFAGDFTQVTSVKSIPGDPIINNSILDFLQQESLAIKFIGIECSFKLTQRGYTLKHFGGFRALREKEEVRVKKSERLHLWLTLGTWLISLVAAFLGGLLAK